MAHEELRAPLVGSRYRPPAALVLECLPAQAPLVLQPEPENPYDEFAIRVHASTAAIPESQWAKLETELPGYGHSLEGLLTSDHVFLGYLASSDTPSGQKAIAANPGSVGNRQIGEAIARAGGRHEASLAFGGNGQPLVVVRPLPEGASP